MKDKSSLCYFWVTLLNIITTITEFIGGAISGSLALLSGVVHNLSDVGSMVLAFVANLISKRKRNTNKIFGYDRAEILAAFTDGIILTVISIYLFIGGIQRSSHPESIRGMIMLIVSLIDLAVNVISMFVVMKKAKTSLNAKATFLNMLSDAITSVAVVLGAIVTSIWKIYWIDPVSTIAAPVFLLEEAHEVTVKAANILVETNPSIDSNKINELVLSCPHVNNIHRAHVWQYSNNVTMLDAHINVDKNLDAIQLEKIYTEIAEKLKPLGVNHVTLQAECTRGIDDKMIFADKGD